jgi:hypothetical protein
MDRYLSVTLFFILLNLSGAFVSSWGLGTVQSSTQVTLPSLASGSGLKIYPNGTVNGAALASGYTGFGSSFFQYVLFVGDWVYALGQFIKTLVIGVVLPSQWIGQYYSNQSFLAIIDAAVYIDYFIFAVLFLRGGRSN